MRLGRKTAVLLAALLPLVWAPSCAFGSRHAYGQEAPVHYKGQLKVAVGTLDQRPYVLQGGCATYVGVVRAWFGLLPINVHTKSRKPFAQDVTYSVARGLSSRGYECKQVELSPNSLREDAKLQLAEAGCDRALLLTLREWDTDTMRSTQVDYEIEIDVLDGSAFEMERDRQAGRQQLSLNNRNTSSYAAWEAVVPFYRSVLELLLNKPEIKRALGGTDVVAGSDDPEPAKQTR